MPSSTDIANRALQILGISSIASLNENSKPARACAISYDARRERELRANEWNFAMARAILPASSIAPQFGRANAFPLPADFLRLLHPDPERNYNDLDWQIENGSIITNEQAPLYIRYIYNAQDPNRFDSCFCEALSSGMAIDMAQQLTQSNQKLQMAKMVYDDAMEQAKITNSFEKVAAKPSEDTWISVRR